MGYRYREGSITAAVLWMIVLSILLFWLPIFGPLIAGFVGGRVAGSATRGLLAATLPAIIIAIGAIIVGGIIGFPFLGIVAGAVLFVVVIVHTVPVILGAIVGGALA